MKDTKCKCTHLKSEHHKRVLLTDGEECENCPCTVFLRHDYPKKSDIIFPIIAIIGIILASLMLIILLPIAYYTAVENGLLENEYSDRTELNNLTISQAIIFSGFIIMLSGVVVVIFSSVLMQEIFDRRLQNWNIREGS